MYSGDSMVRCDRCKRIISLDNRGTFVLMLKNNYTCTSCYNIWDKYYDANDIDNKDYEEEYLKWINKNRVFVFR